MPEIPDLNIFKKNLAKKLIGKILAKVTVLIDRRLKQPVSDIQTAIEGQTLKSIERVGKELHFAFDNGQVLGLHLMLYGSMHWFEKTNEERFTIAELLFEDGTGLAITDWQKAIILTLNPATTNVPDALALPPGYLNKALAKKEKSIKTVLTDGKTVLGIGNAYVDEILYAANISPFSKANKIPCNEVDKLTEEISTVLTEAEAHIMQNFPDTISEKERDFLKVHRPKQTLTLHGEELLKAEIDKRKTYYTERQHLFE